ncbi:MAG: hypothetical protein AAGJ83_13100, partial [Planctomycetota bacterium]
AKIEMAEKHFRHAVDADFAYGPAHNNLGLLHYEQGNLFQAVLAFEHAHEFLPDDPATAYNLALALESGGRVVEARQLYELASQIDPVNPNYLGNLVRLRVRLGERDLDLKSQLEDLVLIETRPEWRKWADTQLALDFNDALDRGPETPDLESSTAETRESDRTELRTKIIDLTPVLPSAPEPLELPPPPPEEDSPDAQDGDDRVKSSIFELLPEGPNLTAPTSDSAPLPAVETVLTLEPASLSTETSESLPVDDYFRSK